MTLLEQRIRELLEAYGLSDLLERLDIEEDDVIILLIDNGIITMEDLNELA